MCGFTTPSCRCHICHSLGIDLGNRVERRGKGSFARTGPNGLTLFTLRPIDHTRDPLDRELWLPGEDCGYTCQRAKRKEKESRIPPEGQEGKSLILLGKGCPIDAPWDLGSSPKRSLRWRLSGAQRTLESGHQGKLPRNS